MVFDAICARLRTLCDERRVRWLPYVLVRWSIRSIILVSNATAALRCGYSVFRLITEYPTTLATATSSILTFASHIHCHLYYNTQFNIILINT